MPNITYNRGTSGFGPSISDSESKSAGAGLTASVNIPKGKAGSLTTRGGNTTGTITLAAGHGFYNTQSVDIYYSSGKRLAVTLASVTSTTVAVSGGAGTNLPVQDTAIVVSKRVPITGIAFDEDLVSFVAMQLSASGTLDRGNAHFIGPTSPVDITLTEKNVVVYDIENGASHPFAGFQDSAVKDTSINVSNGSSSVNATFTLTVLFDATPGSPS